MLSKCCCFVELELGSKIIAFIIMLFSVACISGEAYFLSVRDVKYTPLGVSKILLEVIDFDLGAILLLGVYKSKPSYLVMFVYCMTLLNFTQLMLLFFLVIFEKENQFLLIGLCFAYVIRSYFVLVVESLYRKNLIARLRTLVDLLYEEITSNNKKKSSIDYLFKNV